MTDNIYLLSGKPGSGKTSIIKEALSKTERNAGGFYTDEIRKGGSRVGFRIITLCGQNRLLSHIKLDSPYNIGKYKVDISSIDEVAVPAVREAILHSEIIVIDEIGKMELLSPLFRDVVTEALECEKKVLGTVLLSPHPWVDGIKMRPEVDTVIVTVANYSNTLDHILRWLES